MTELVNGLLEKNINFWFRLALRVMAWGTLMVMMIWKIWKPIFSDPCGHGVHFNGMEIWILIGAIALILSIEGVKYAVDQYLNKKSK